MSDNTITIQTIQPFSVLDTIKQKGIAYSKPDFSIWDNSKNNQWGFFHAYEWMKKEMINKKINPPNNEKDVFWGWVWSNDLNKKEVDLRTRKNLKGNYLLTIEKNIEDVLLSDFDLWHYVLNYWALSTTKKEELYWNNTSKTFNYFKEKPIQNKEIHQEIEKSWQLIFDIKYKNGIYINNVSNIKKKFLELTNNPITVQGTFWNIQEIDIKNIQKINT